MLLGFSIFITLDYTLINRDSNENFPSSLSNCCHTEGAGASIHFLPADAPGLFLFFLFCTFSLSSSRTVILVLTPNSKSTKSLSLRNVCVRLDHPALPYCDVTNPGVCSEHSSSPF